MPRVIGASAALAAAVLAAAVLAAAVLAGCASPAVGPHAAAKVSRTAGAAGQGKAVAVVPVGPPPGTRAEAEGFAQQMLSAVILPAGSRQLPHTRQPSFLRNFAGYHAAAVPVVSPFQLYRLPMPISAAISFVQAHLPRGDGNADWSEYRGTDDAVVGQFVDAQAQAVPAGIDLGDLEYAVVPGRGGSSVLQVNAEVAWYPPRPVAEDFAPASYRAVKLLGRASHGHTVAKTFTSPQLIGRLVGLLDALHVSTKPASTCGLLGPGESGLELFPVARGQPPVFVYEGCPGYSIYLGTKAEPPLQPQYPKDKLMAQIARLLGLPG